MPLLFRHTAPLFAVWHITEDAESLFTALYNKETYRPQLDAPPYRYAPHRVACLPRFVANPAGAGR